MFIYVIAESPFGPCKIGVATRSEERLAACQTGNPRRLTLHYSAEIPAHHDALKVERLAHDYADVRRRLMGEWFSIEVIDATIACDQALEMIENLPRSAMTQALMDVMDER